MDEAASGAVGNDHASSSPATATAARYAASAASAGALAEQPPRSFVIVHNIGKRQNVGTIARCATAFGVCEVLIVGERAFNTFGSHGSDAHVAFRHFASLLEARRFVKEDWHGVVVGIEIMDGAVSVASEPFHGNTAFMLGNEGQGLSDAQKAACDSFIYIPQFGEGTASLNVAVACGIVLHRFASWAGYTERGRDGEKFCVADRPLRRTPRGMVGDSPDAVRAARAAKREAAAAANADPDSAFAFHSESGNR